jgi:hypothetical protein
MLVGLQGAVDIDGGGSRRGHAPGDLGGPTVWEPSMARRVMLSPSERVKEAGSTWSDPLGWAVGESPTMAGSEPPEQAEMKKARTAEAHKG